MPIQTVCPGCRAPLTLVESMAGKKIRCGKCQKIIQVKLTQKPVVEDACDEIEVIEAYDEIEVVEEFEEPRTRIKADPPQQSVSALGRGHDLPARQRQALQTPPRNNVPWIVGGAVACCALLAAGAVGIALVLRGEPEKAQAVAPQNAPAAVTVPPVALAANATAVNVPVPANPAPVTTPAPVPVPASTAVPVSTPTSAPPSPVEDTKAPPRDPTRRGELTREARELVKRATVYLRVTRREGVASGTGFFGAPDAPNIVLTNAHVVGMLAPNSAPPSRIEVIINSGEKDERMLTARILGVDRSSDLAVLDVGTTDGMPRALTVKTADSLQELDKVFVFGFPLGEQLGKEITIRPSSVSSLRKRDGLLDKVQVAGGMDPGNSGGPVIDESGHVVGVAVSGIPGRMINFAIPGQCVHQILEGRVMQLAYGQPFRNGARVGLPVTLAMIDPRHRVKDVGFEVWVGNAPDTRAPRRPPSSSIPTPVNGDEARQRYNLSYLGGIGRGELTLPELPPGKVYWVQPFWMHADGQTRWGMGAVYKMAGAPLERRAENLFARYGRGGPRKLDVTILNKLRVGADAETEVASFTTRATMTETGASSGRGSQLRLGYKSAEQTAVINKRKRSNPKLAEVRPILDRLIGLVDLDVGGNISSNTVANVEAMRSSEQGRDLLSIHEPVQYALFTLLLPMPNRKVNPQETWKVQRVLGVSAPGGLRRYDLDLTCIYLGVRGQSGRDEALVTLEGLVRDSSLSGRARGLAVVDVSTGTVREVRLDMELDMPPLEFELEDGKKEKLRVVSEVSMKLERAL